MTTLIVIEYHRFYLHGGQQSFLYLLVATFSFSLWMIILILQGPYPHSRYMVLSGVEIRKLSLSVSSLISIFGLTSVRKIVLNQYKLSILALFTFKFLNFR